MQEARERYSIPGFDLVISDLRLPGAPGTELIGLAGATPVLIMTSYASLRSAVDSMKLALSTTSPSRSTTTRCWKRWRASCASGARRRPPETPCARAARGARAEQGAGSDEIGIIGRCAAMQDLFGKIRKAAPTDSATVLINGESGTGKELVARALHRHAARAKAPLIRP